MTREKVLEIMQKADMFSGPDCLGGYGMASTEAMAFGKPRNVLYNAAII